MRRGYGSRGGERTFHQELAGPSQARIYDFENCQRQSVYFAARFRERVDAPLAVEGFREVFASRSCASSFSTSLLGGNFESMSLANTAVSAGEDCVAYVRLYHLAAVVTADIKLAASKRA